MNRGFTIIELLIALTITLLIAGALVSVAQSARAAFDRLPAELELQQRGRTAVDVLSQALRASGKDVAATAHLGPFRDLLPTVLVSEPDESGAFTELTVILPVADAAQGVLLADQAGPAAPMILGTTACPNVKEVCGFSSASTAVIADGAGSHDVFSIAATNAGARLLTPAGPLSLSYPAGSVVVEVEQFTFSLAAQTDGTYSLIRTTAAGAVQPIVDFVNGLWFDASVGEVAVTVSLQAPTESLRGLISDRVFRSSIRLRNGS
jgi:prepilin-type N-terminal cleavage/methylation domain-containing protein